MQLRLKDFINYGGQRRNKEVMIARVSTHSNSPKIGSLAGVYWDLLVTTDYLKEATYLHMVKQLKYTEIEQVTGQSYHAIRNCIYRDKQRVQADIGMDIYDYIEEREYTNVLTDQLMTVIESLVTQHEVRDTGDIFAHLTVDLNGYTYNRTIDIEDMEFIKLVDVLAPLSKKYTDSLIEGLGRPDMIGYIKYLLGTDSRHLSNSDKQRKQVLLQSWWLTDGY